MERTVSDASEDGSYGPIADSIGDGADAAQGETGPGIEEAWAVHVAGASVLMATAIMLVFEQQLEP